jgi:hypothetical protein
MKQRVANGSWRKPSEARLLAESFRAVRRSLFPDESVEGQGRSASSQCDGCSDTVAAFPAAALQAELGAMKNMLAGLQSSATGLEATRRAKEQQSKLLLEELKGLRELAADGYLPRNRLSEQERLLAQLGGRHFRGSGQPGPHSAEHRRNPDADAGAPAGVSTGGRERTGRDRRKRSALSTAASRDWPSTWPIRRCAPVRRRSSSA